MYYCSKRQQHTSMISSYDSILVQYFFRHQHHSSSIWSGFCVIYKSPQKLFSGNWSSDSITLFDPEWYDHHIWDSTFNIQQNDTYLLYLENELYHGKIIVPCRTCLWIFYTKQQASAGTLVRQADVTCAQVYTADIGWHRQTIKVLCCALITRTRTRKQVLLRAPSCRIHLRVAPA